MVQLPVVRASGNLAKMFLDALGMTLQSLQSFLASECHVTSATTSNPGLID